MYISIYIYPIALGVLGVTSDAWHMPTLLPGAGLGGSLVCRVGAAVGVSGASACLRVELWWNSGGATQSPVRALAFAWQRFLFPFR